MTDSAKRWQFWLDVGGTFTDCIALTPSGHKLTHKTLSSGVVKGRADEILGQRELVDRRRHHDPGGVWRGYSIRFNNSASLGTVVSSDGARIAFDIDLPPEIPFSYELFSDESAPLVAIRYLLGLGRHDALPPVDIRLGTTRGTNALLTRTGARTAVVTTAGFADLWDIGYQSRPDLFSLDIQKPIPLYEKVVEVRGRMTSDGEVLVPCDLTRAEELLCQLVEDGFESLSICLLHATVNPAHEMKIAELARRMSFRNISVSHEVSSVRKAVPRGDTTIVDAYLTPILRDYVDQLQAHLHPASRMDVMTSSGGLTSAKDFRGKDSILSGPAGGVVGVSHVARSTGNTSAIGFDMGGTSTDVTRWAGNFELEYETEKAGVRVVTPMMKIETVAAGGGSICRFDGVKLVVGPESAGADPGPACYGSGGPLTVTDINFYLGRILADAFPFALDHAAVQKLLEHHCDQIATALGKRFSPAELAAGYLRVANTNMVEAIRCVTVDQGVDPRGHVLVSFGGAAAQHACGVARALGIAQVLIHPQAGILSALGIGHAAITAHRERGVYQPLEEVNDWHSLFEPIRTTAEAELRRKLPECHCQHADYLDVRFAGLEDTLTIARPNDDLVRDAYERAFLERHGYLPVRRDIEVVIVRVVATATTPETTAISKPCSPPDELVAERVVPMLWDATEVAAEVVPRTSLQPGHRIVGPAIITESISTTVVDPDWQADVLSNGELLLTRGEQTVAAQDNSPSLTQVDPVLLEVFNKRFEAIATQMGSTLRKTSRSVNVKERLDFSCAIFTSDGGLVVNAPHIPVHLGAMGATVRHILQLGDIEPGDVFVTNDPYRGGSHLPDVTVITPVHDPATNALLFFTASRAHHAEIGGTAPGSMPPSSKTLAEEGVLIPAMKVVQAGVARWNDLRALLENHPHPSRDPDTNLADMQAQLAANHYGAAGLLGFVREHGWELVSAYMEFIQAAAESQTRAALRDLPDEKRTFVDHLDDGSPISVQLSIHGDRAVLDFSGTGDVLPSNLNANRAIVTAAVMYCMRSLLAEEIPLNQGVLTPIEIRLPTCLLAPSPGNSVEACPAVVGGNVETSQRVVDVVLGAFGVAAASQGTMNNFLFGNDTFGYYETICGGSGATARGPGADAIHTHMTNTRLTDVEVLERRFPVRVRAFQVRQGSGGFGRHRGGHGVLREIEFLAPLRVSLLTQRRGPFPPYGLDGGLPGALGRNTLLVDGVAHPLPGVTQLDVEPGHRVRIETPGGGGWGKAPER